MGGAPTTLDESGEIERLSAAVDRLPVSIADRPEFARYRARVYQDQGNWELAERWYRLALKAAPADHMIKYRLIRVLRNRGKSEEALQLERDYMAFQNAKNQALSIYDEANEIHGQRKSWARNSARRSRTSARAWGYATRRSPGIDWCQETSESSEPLDLTDWRRIDCNQCHTSGPDGLQSPGARVRTILLLALES